MLESDLKKLKVFIYSLILIMGLLFFLWIFILWSYPYTSRCWKYQPEISWYSGPIGYDCGCK